jgi:hypothetical protein
MVDGHGYKETTTKMRTGAVTQAGGDGSPTSGRWAVRFALCLSAAFALLCFWGASANAYEALNEFTMIPSGTQAGGHPDVNITMEWDDSEIKDGNFASPSNPCACDDARLITQHFPTGFIGNPNATPVCELVEFSFGRCPASTQVGTTEPLGPFGYVALYNVAPHPDEPSLTAFWVPLVSAPVFISLGGRTESDYGLDAQSSPIFHPLAGFHSLAVELWGVPADHKNDSKRFIPPLKEFGFCGLFGCEGVGIAANVPPIPYLQSPTACNVPLTGGVDLEYYTHTVFHGEYPWPATTGCEQLTFNPSLSAEPTTRSADSASGVDIDLKVPQELSPTTPSPSEIRDTVTKLPVGFSINPNVGDGKVSCSDPDTAIGTRHGATCPEFSKVGTLVLDSSALPVPIPGAIYLGEPKPGDRYRLILAADGFGTHIKLAGSVRPDPQTGQVVVEFDELPQTPLTEFNMHFFGSERGLLATPTQCGSYPVESVFTPWDGALPTQKSLSSFEVTSGPGGSACPTSPRSFSPTLRAGSVNPTAGRHSSFSLEIERADGDQNLSAIDVTAPPGFAATLKGVPYCPDAALAQISDASYTGSEEIANSQCPAGSQIGVSTAGAGAGSRPVFLPGKVYLAGPYKGAPLSIAVVTPAVSGPYDLGNVVVRAAISVDPTTAQVTAVSDPLPRILAGIPLRLRQIKVDLNRPNFVVNPTNCDPFAVTVLALGEEGGFAHPQAPFQVANCASLPYGPKLGLRLTGGLKRRGHPAIHATFTAKPGEANTKSVAVALPKGELLDNAHIGTICTRVAFAANTCPAGSVLGEAQVSTPLLAQPLSGKVYLRSSNHQLPDLVMDLRGQIDIVLVGRIDTVKGGALRTTFSTVPDAPVTSLKLDLAGGPRGLLVNSTSLCGATKKASVDMVGQNNAVVETTSKLKTACGSKARHKRHHKRHHHRGAVR